MSLRTVNHNNIDPHLHKNHRRKMIVRAARRHLGSPNDVFLLPGMRGQDAALIRQSWKTVPILGIERSDVVIDQMDMLVFGDPLIEFYRYHFNPFLARTGMEPNPSEEKTWARTRETIFHKKGGPTKEDIPVSIDVMRSLNTRKFDLAYLDFVQNCDDITIKNVEDFLRDRTRERFIVAVANSVPRAKDHRDRFAEYESIATRFGAQFYRRDYKDSSKMNFAIMVR